MWNFMWLDIDSSLQTNDLEVTRQFLWLNSTKSWLWLDSKIWDDYDSKGLWLWLDRNDSGTSLEHVQLLYKEALPVKIGIRNWNWFYLSADMKSVVQTHTLHNAGR